MPRGRNKSKADNLFIRACRHEDDGDSKSAFRLMLAAAKLGDTGAQVNVGNYYDAGIGVRQNRAAAMYWYKRAYSRGYSCAAHNIGIIWRNEKQHRRALAWFRRAVELGDDDSSLDIGKHYLYEGNNPAKAIAHFKRVIRAKSVTGASVEEATLLLREAEKRLNSKKKAND
jgi:tetratricopeptide (TPR) repeat protein